MRVNQVVAPRQDLPGLYRELVLRNPLLGRVEGEAKLAGWTDEEVRTVQLLVAVRSNESLQARLTELEAGLRKR